MGKVTNGLFLLLVLSVLGACERVKEKEGVADLPQTSVEDTLVLAPDTLEIDTALTASGLAESATTESGTAVDVYSDAKTQHLTSDGSTPGSNVVTSSPVSRAETSSAAGSASSGAGKASSPSRKRYVRPTKAQLQRSLALDARKSNQMDLPQLKNYWQKRQHYYRRASNDVKYVAGDTKIKISSEETKIETPRGKVKIEGTDVKIKYD